MTLKAIATSALTALGTMTLAAGAYAQSLPADLPTVGKPHAGGIGFQPASTEVARDLQWLDGFILAIITAIVLFVVSLIAIVILRYNSRANPRPASFTHNSPVEVAWTLIPIVILVVIGAFSLPTLFKQQQIPVADITIKATGHQWYWTYEYVDNDFAFDSYMIGQPATGGDYRLTPEVAQMLQDAGYSRDEFLLAADKALVLPINKTIVVQVTADDVIHSWTVPAFGVKQDGVPGRLAQLWFSPEREGVFFGQCSELCGKDHAFMPITVKVVSQEAYEAWLDDAIKEFAGTPRAVDLASAE